MPKPVKLYTGRYKSAWGERWTPFQELTLKDLGGRLNRNWVNVRNRIKAYSPHKRIVFNGQPVAPKRKEIPAMLLEIYEVK